MALVSLFGPFKLMSGSIGGYTVTASTKFTVIKAHHASRRRRLTPAQSAHRRLMARATRFYGALNSSQTEEWRAYAAAIDQYNRIGSGPAPPNPQALLTARMINQQLLDAASSIDTSPPGTPYAGEDVTFTATGGSGSIALVNHGTTSATGYAVLYTRKLSFIGQATVRAGGTVKFSMQLPTDEDTNYITPIAPGDYRVRARFINFGTGEATAFIDVDDVTVT